MKKSDFIALLLGVVGTLVFGIGMCMCLLPEWNAFNEGVIVTAAGAILLIILTATRIKGSAKEHTVNWKLMGKIAFGILGALVLGVGMCMILVWNMMLWGIVVGAVGIVLLLCLIPMFVGLK